MNLHKDPFSLWNDAPYLLILLIIAIIAMSNLGCRSIPLQKHQERMSMIHNQLEDIKKGNSLFIMKLRLEGLQSVVRKYVNDF